MSKSHQISSKHSNLSVHSEALLQWEQKSSSSLRAVPGIEAGKPLYLFKAHENINQLLKFRVPTAETSALLN